LACAVVMSFFALPGGEFGEQSLESVGGLSALLGELLAAVDQHPQRRHMADS
jgi:hypothetical protein